METESESLEYFMHMFISLYVYIPEYLAYILYAYIPEYMTSTIFLPQVHYLMVLWAWLAETVCTQDFSISKKESYS